MAEFWLWLDRIGNAAFIIYVALLFFLAWRVRRLEEKVAHIQHTAIGDRQLFLRMFRLAGIEVVTTKDLKVSRNDERTDLG